MGRSDLPKGHAGVGRFHLRLGRNEACGEVVAGSMVLNGKTIDPTATYRVSVPNFLADGGDGLTVFKRGQHRELGAADIEATDAYLKSHNPIAPKANKRVQRVN